MIKRISVKLPVTTLLMFVMSVVTAVAGDTTSVRTTAAQEKCDIPTLGEWGLIIFCILLVGWMAWVIVRKRKPAKLHM
ncbi:MAG: IPTL-CTERM sorting domain-containing protein [candidate division Zixibacteria bacterium]|nr:IPTL-CTERM sorting domain-containing protein [candidate division Zixibacteria bacterium]